MDSRFRGNDGGQIPCSQRVPWQACLSNFIGYGITHGKEPLAAAVRVKPPFLLRVVAVRDRVAVAKPRLVTRPRFRPRFHLTAKAKLVDAPLAAVGTWDQERHANSEHNLHTCPLSEHDGGQEQNASGAFDTLMPPRDVSCKSTRTNRSFSLQCPKRIS